MGIQAEAAALGFTSQPIGRQPAIFAVICVTTPVVLFSIAISDELR